MNTTPNPARLTARWVGVLMLSAFLLYGIGSALATSAAAPDSGGAGLLLVAGAAMMLLNSAAVIAIGLLMLPILRPRTPIIAVGYLASRIFEGVVLAIGVISLLTLSAGAIAGNFLAYNIAMTGLGIGSLFFCVALFRSRLVPRFLAVWGFVGYASFALGCILELLGVAGAGLVSTVPGGLFELFFGVWLIVKGFNPAAITAPITPIAPVALRTFASQS
ncbi:DUF4386 domain-containing protein [Agromyces albus]|uniref:DUF4386 domain-containing protein n=1 Tax=Agromyces albus TaxID=205332 RepID=A0A4Q2L5I9_9MICO|nr:DUF4386 domain-containing protein [Agromyces albus]RXZ72949.1 DUF4386 domain-containing protein [Agromyces albus]